MPLHLEPNQKFDIVLDCDQNKPIESRPTFFALSQSMRGQLKILAQLDRLNEPEVTVPELFRETCATIASVICGWRHMSYEYTRETCESVLTDLLSYQEARELLKKIAYNQHMDNDQKKD